MSRNSKVSQKYQKKSHLEHIKERPDTYIGSCETRCEPMWVFCESKKCMEYRDVNYVPGLYKIFDEILVNAADNKQRDLTMKAIRVTVTPERITIENDGCGIPIVMHETEHIWVPQLVFGELLSGDNYDDSDDRVVGGRNGYGAKLANIFSSTFCVETVDSKVNKIYTQSWHNNMSKVDNPSIKSAGKRKDFTRVTFAPDFATLMLIQWHSFKNVSMILQALQPRMSVFISMVSVYQSKISNSIVDCTFKMRPRLCMNK